MVMEHLNVRSPTKYVYSEKIKERRRSLFPHEKLCEIVDNTDLGQMSPLSSSDTEYNHDLKVHNVNEIESTKFISDLFSTPKSRNYEQTISCNGFESCSYTAGSVTSISPSKHLKTPNDSSINSGVLPKLSRRSTHEFIPDSDDCIPMSPKCSKVRTSLFPEPDISFAPTQFYPTIKSPKHTANKLYLLRPNMRREKTKTRSRYKKKRSNGQINAGVYHRIKKPKENKPDVVSKCSINLLTKIKTYKKESAVRSEFSEFFKDLEDLNKTKEVKLIQHVPVKNLPVNTTESSQTSNLKRPNEIGDIVVSKRLKLDSYETVTNSTLTVSDSCELIELIDTDLEIECPQDIDAILNSLNNVCEENKENESVTFARIDRDFSETLLSPTSEMCNMTSGMKLDSPTKVKNLNPVFQFMEDSKTQQSSKHTNNNHNKPEYFPIFYPNSTKSDRNLSRSEPCPKRKKLKISSDQMLLDAGQKKFGLVNCTVCNYVYNAGDPNDENMHDKHHNISHVLQFGGWKNEHVLEKLPDGARIIVVLPRDLKIWVDKAQRVVEVINQDMGDYDLPVDISASKVFLYIVNKSIEGCLVAEGKFRGFKVLPSEDGIDMCSREGYPIKCGISKIWISSRFRRKGIATKMMEVLRYHFITDCVLEKSDIALSSLTDDGKLFAARYFQTPNFFTYFD